MDRFVTPGIVIGVLALAYGVLRAAADLRSLLAVPARKEHITRAEYEKDEKARKEQHNVVLLKCRGNERRRVRDRVRSDERLDALVKTLTELQIQLARLATWLERGEPGGHLGPKET